MSLTLVLPEPPSANSYWRRAGKVLHLTHEARAYRRAVASAYLRATKTGRVRYPREEVGITITWYRKRKLGDLDNRLKQLLDALSGVAYHDDSQIVEIHAHRRDDPSNPRVEIVVSPAHPSLGD